MWTKIVAFFKHIASIYYKWKKRNEDLTKFLADSKNNEDRIKHIDTTVTSLNEDVQHIKEHVKGLDEQITYINGRLDIIGEGTKMELFDTLHNWRTELITRGWATYIEKQEVENIYKIYRFELKGNGQGQRYYDEIMALPESEEEMKRKQGGQ